MSKSLDKIKAKLAHKQVLVRTFMASEAGQEIIRVLEEEFCEGNLVGIDAYSTYYNLGRRDVVTYLKQIAQWRKD